MKNSRKLLVSLAALVLLSVPVLRAQDAAPATPPADKPEHRKGERGGPGGGMGERIAKELNLTADQQTKWKAIGEQERTALEAIRADASLEKDAKRAKAMETNKTFAEQRKAVLTPDQQTKFDDMRAKMREHGPKGPKGPKKDKPEAN